ncbi:MAG TPA: type II 3-dehydroquinate dehydratase [Thermopetrobacter sp.]|nr:type II 3-dehydroquinate dehydratase [Thermopetrobacter sp.]
MAARVFIINGPNLNLLGVREPDTYGRATLDDIRAMCEKRAAALGLSLTFSQHNMEGALVEQIHAAIAADAAAIIINAGAYTHTSIAIHDALRAFAGLIVEVHLSNIQAREDFRHTSHIAPVADGIIMGLGAMGYELALQAVAARTGS